MWDWIRCHRQTRHIRRSRYDLSNMRARQRRQLEQYIQDPLTPGVGVHLLPLSALREKNALLSRSRYKCYVSIRGALVLSVLAFSRLPGTSSSSSCVCPFTMSVIPILTYR